MGVKGDRFWNLMPWIHISALPFNICVASGKLFHLFASVLFIYKMGIILVPTSKAWYED